MKILQVGLPDEDYERLESIAREQGGTAEDLVSRWFGLMLVYSEEMTWELVGGKEQSKVLH